MMNLLSLGILDGYITCRYTSQESRHLGMEWITGFGASCGGLWTK